MQLGGPSVVLKHPNRRTVVRIRGNGNCLFHSLLHVITGSQDQHLAICHSIVAHMRLISHFLAAHTRNHGDSNPVNAIDTYISSVGMENEGTWGTDVEILAAAHLLQTSIF